MNQTNASERLKPRQAAAYLGLSFSALAKARVDGTGPAFLKLGKRAVAYDRGDLDAWLASRRRTSTSDPGPTAGQ